MQLSYKKLTLAFCFYKQKAFQLNMKGIVKIDLHVPIRDQFNL